MASDDIMQKQQAHKLLQLVVSLKKEQKKERSGRLRTERNKSCCAAYVPMSTNESKLDDVRTIFAGSLYQTLLIR
jgi:hypothetical protein